MRRARPPAPREASENVITAPRRCGRALNNDALALALLIGVLASGAYLIHSMTVTRSVVRVRIAAVVSIVLTLAFMIVLARGG